MLNIPPVPYSPDTRKYYEQSYQYIRFVERQTNGKFLFKTFCSCYACKIRSKARQSYRDAHNHIDILDQKTVFWQFFIDKFPNREKRRERYKANRSYLYRQTTNFPRKGAH